jgi:hypothetical protein
MSDDIDDRARTPRPTPKEPTAPEPTVTDGFDTFRPMSSAIMPPSMMRLQQSPPPPPAPMSLGEMMLNHYGEYALYVNFHVAVTSDNNLVRSELATRALPAPGRARSGPELP